MPINDPVESSAILQGIQSMRERSRSRSKDPNTKPRSRAEKPPPPPEEPLEAALATSVSNDVADLAPPVPITVLVHPPSLLRQKDAASKNKEEQDKQASQQEGGVGVEQRIEAVSLPQLPLSSLQSPPEPEPEPEEPSKDDNEKALPPELSPLEQEFARSLGQKITPKTPPPPQPVKDVQVSGPSSASAPQIATKSQAAQPHPPDEPHGGEGEIIKSASRHAQAHPLSSESRMKPEKHVHLSQEALQNALPNQWPPVDQVNHEKVDAYERFEPKKPLEHILPRYGQGRWFDLDLDPSTRRRYRVSEGLKEDWKAQANFFARFMILKAVQLALINVWIAIVGSAPEVRSFVTSEHNWLYLPLGIFFLLLTAIRLFGKRKRHWYPFVIALALILLAFLIAYPLAAVAFTYNAYCIIVTTGLLLLTSLTLPFAPFLTKSTRTVTSVQITRIGAVLILAYAVLLLVAVAYMGVMPDMGRFAILDWFPGILLAEGTLWVLIQEFQRVLAGASFHVSEKRWAFTALYV